MFQINMPKWKISSIPAVSVDREVKCSTVQLYSLDHYHLAAPLGNLAGQWQPHNMMRSSSSAPILLLLQLVLTNTVALGRPASVLPMVSQWKPHPRIDHS